MADIINHRAQQILKILIGRYIQDGAPVGSRTIAEESALGLSPATIRNILADLEDNGYLISPHTSAGRVPTTRGYRVFVDSLLTVKPLQTVVASELSDALNRDADMPTLLQNASSLLSGLTQMIGVVAVPKRNQVKLRQVEFLSLSSNRVLVIMVLNDREVQNRIIYTDKSYSATELQQAANYLNTHCVGKDLTLVQEELLLNINHDKESMTSLLKAAMDLANTAVCDKNKDYVMAGQNDLLSGTKKGELENLYNLFQAFTQKQEILHLLNHSIAAEGIQIFIGGESGYEAFDECSIVTTSYAVDGQLIGSLGVIGPTRMPYERVIAAVDVTSRLLSAALNQG